MPTSRRPSSAGKTPVARVVARAAEGMVAAAAGAGLAALFLSVLGPFPPAAGAAGAAAAGLNGAVSGASGIYEWRRLRGWAAFAADSTWGLAGTALGLVLHGAALLSPRPGWSAELSRRRNRHVYERGRTVRRGFALCLGNAVTGGGGPAGLSGEGERAARRRRLVEAHEQTHIFQNRLLGPLYVLGYALWTAAGAVAGLATALLTDRGRVWTVVETFAYYDNPFEYWAYRKDRNWPPPGAHPRFAWPPRNKIPG